MSKEQIIYVAHYEGDVLCAFIDEERAKKDCEESGVTYQKTTLYL